jgi:hypothetical protein
MRPRGGQDRLDRREIPAYRLRFDGDAKPAQSSHDRTEGVSRDLEPASDDGLANHRSGALERLHQDQWRELSEIRGCTAVGLVATVGHGH